LAPSQATAAEAAQNTIGHRLRFLITQYTEAARTTMVSPRGRNNRESGVRNLATPDGTSFKVR
jgi:hypothetical protein